MRTHLEEAKFAMQFAAEGLKPALEILKTGGKVALQTHIKEVVEYLYSTKCGFGRTSCRCSRSDAGTNRNAHSNGGAV
jgi:hypothetical protein